MGKTVSETRHLVNKVVKFRIKWLKKCWLFWVGKKFFHFYLPPPRNIAILLQLVVITDLSLYVYWLLVVVILQMEI